MESGILIPWIILTVMWEKCAVYGDGHEAGRVPKDHFVPGRMAMTCCAEDMAFPGLCLHFQGMRTALRNRTG